MTGPHRDRRFASGLSPYEQAYAFSRAIRVGSTIHVAGTAPVWADGSVDPSPAAQARRCWSIVSQALLDVGASMDDVVRTRMYITDPQIADDVGSIHAEQFRRARPAATMVVVAGLLDPRWKVEVEAEAIAGL